MKNLLDFSLKSTWNNTGERERGRGLAMFRQPLDLVTVSADVEVSDLSNSLNGLPDVSP